MVVVLTDVDHFPDLGPTRVIIEVVIMTNKKGGGGTPSTLTFGPTCRSTPNYRLEQNPNFRRFIEQSRESSRSLGLQRF